MKRLKILGAVVLSSVLAACGSSSSSTPAAVGFPKPAGTIAVGVIVDDTANHVYTAGQMKLKGQIAWTTATRIASVDANWTGTVADGWPLLYDDGPWDVDPPGHEPHGQVAGDHKWGVTVFVTPPAAGSTTFSYGLIDVPYETSYGNGWMWPSSTNGSVVVAAGATADITQTAVALPSFGTIDMQIVVDILNLDPVATWDTSTVKNKGTSTLWSPVTLLDDGLLGDATAADGKFTFQLSNFVGAGKQFARRGLLKSGDKPEWIFLFGPGAGTEYKDAATKGALTGVTAAVKAAGAGSWTPVTPTQGPVGGNGNTTITVP